MIGFGNQTNWPRAPRAETSTLPGDSARQRSGDELGGSVAAPLDAAPAARASASAGAGGAIRGGGRPDLELARRLDGREWLWRLAGTDRHFVVLERMHVGAAIFEADANGVSYGGEAIVPWEATRADALAVLRDRLEASA